MRKNNISILGTVIFFILIGFSGPAAASPYDDFDFDDITYWVGEGENQAALVIDWNDGKDAESLAWGYRWDGEAYGIDMLTAIAGSITVTNGSYEDTPGDEPRLNIVLTMWESLGYALVGIGYDQDNDGFGITFGEWEWEDGEASDPDDHYEDGWYSGYWSYWGSNGVISWRYAALGISNRKLSDGHWDGWSFSDTAEYGAGSPPDTPVAASQAPVPIPGAVLLLGSGLIGLLGIRQKFNAR